MKTQFFQRLASSAIAVSMLAIFLSLSQHQWLAPLFVLLCGWLISKGLQEYYRLAVAKGYQPLSTQAIVYGCVYVLATYLALQRQQFEFLPDFILLFSFVLFFLSFFNKNPAPLANLAVTLFGLVYLVIPISCVLRINYFALQETPLDGRFWLVYVLSVTKACDIGAYFTGKILGQNKLAPSISPKKTIEGAIGGLIASVAVSFLFQRLLFEQYRTAAFSLQLWQSLLLGLLFGILAQIGDLSESILKRDAGVQDSSDLPGLGGILDMMDSLVFTLPLMYLLMKMGFFIH